MKKRTLWILTIMLALSLCVPALAQSGTSALDAFSAITGQSLTTPAPTAVAQSTVTQQLDDVMNGVYATEPADTASAQQLAPALSTLSAITSRQLSQYASQKGLAVEQVRNAYYKSLANALRAEIMINPASQEQYRNIQVVLSLFLDQDTDEVSVTSRQAIRSSMTRDYANTIAQSYNLPTSFVEFIVMDENWDDDDWTNDDDWTRSTGWQWSYGYTDDYVDTPAYLDTPDYYNTPDYYDTPDYHDTPAHQDTPDYHDTPAHQDTPDYHDTPDYYDTPDYDRGYRDT